MIFGEAVQLVINNSGKEAILTGDALLTIAFQWLAATGFTAEVKATVIGDLAQAAGPEGMIAGQLQDIEGNHQRYTIEQLKNCTN